VLAMCSGRLPLGRVRIRALRGRRDLGLGRCFRTGGLRIVRSLARPDLVPCAGVEGPGGDVNGIGPLEFVMPRVGAGAGGGARGFRRVAHGVVARLGARIAPCRDDVLCVPVRQVIAVFVPVLVVILDFVVVPVLVLVLFFVLVLVFVLV